MVARGGIYSIEHPQWGRRPVLVLTRDAAIPALKRVTVDSITRQVRGIPGWALQYPPLRTRLAF